MAYFFKDTAPRNDIDEWVLEDDTRNDNNDTNPVQLPPVVPLPDPKIADVSAIINVSHQITMVDANWLRPLFPTKSEEKIKEWLSILRSEEFDSVDDLVSFGATNPHWEKLKLPLNVKSIIQAYIVEELRKRQYKIDNPLPSVIKAIDQIDIIVIDVSNSMKSRSTLDIDKTREDVSKMLFHTLIDKLLVMELSHAVGLLAFGERVTPINITTNYETFHVELGRLDAREGSTALYDAIHSAVDMIDTFCADHVTQTQSKLLKRIFVLTDGEDNASKEEPWQIAQLLQDRNVLLDAIPIAGSFESAANRTLQALCTASGGMCFAAVSQYQAVNLFEREAALHVAFRESTGGESTSRICSPQDLDRLVESMATLQAGPKGGVQQVQSASNKALATPCVAPTKLLAQDTTATRSSSRSPAAVKRILREYKEFCSVAPPHWQVFVSAEDCCVWKVVLSGLEEPACYQGGRWMLSVQFPSDYPFRPPRVRFVTALYHCNVSVDGAICLDVLKDQWAPSFTMVKVFAAIEALLQKPDEFGFLDAIKGSQYTDWLRNKVPTYFIEATKFTLQYSSQSFEDFAVAYNLYSEEDN